MINCAVPLDPHTMLGAYIFKPYGTEDHPIQHRNTEGTSEFPCFICYWPLLVESISGFYSNRSINTLRPRQDGRYFADDVLKYIFLNENVWISLNIPLKFVPRGPINNIPALVQIMVWRRPGDKPLSEPMVVSLLTHICVTRPQCLDTSRGARDLRRIDAHMTSL